LLLRQGFLGLTWREIAGQLDAWNTDATGALEMQIAALALFKRGVAGFFANDSFRILIVPNRQNWSVLTLISDVPASVPLPR